MTTDEQSNGQQQSIAQDSDEATPPPIAATPVDLPIVGIGASAWEQKPASVPFRPFG